MTEENNQNLNFKALGFEIENLSILFGLFLILWGIIISLISNSSSLTSYIPSFIGFPILVFSFLSKKIAQKKKLFMHFVVIFGLIVFFGGLDFLRSIFNDKAFDNIWADITKLVMLITGGFFSYICVKYFIHVRKNKKFES